MVAQIYREKPKHRKTRDEKAPTVRRHNSTGSSGSAASASCVDLTNAPTQSSKRRLSRALVVAKHDSSHRTHRDRLSIDTAAPPLLARPRTNGTQAALPALPHPLPLPQDLSSLAISSATRTRRAIGKRHRLTSMKHLRAHERNAARRARRRRETQQEYAHCLGCFLVQLLDREAAWDVHEGARRKYSAKQPETHPCNAQTRCVLRSTRTRVSQERDMIKAHAQRTKRHAERRGEKREAMRRRRTIGTGRQETQAVARKRLRRSGGAAPTAPRTRPPRGSTSGGASLDEQAVA